MMNNENDYIVDYPLSNDIIFVETFSNIKPLHSLISAILPNLNFNVDDIELSSTTLHSGIDLKSSELDIHFTISNLIDIDLEMQNQRPRYKMERRLLFYLSQILSRSMEKGDNYLGKDCYVICLLNFELFKNDDKCVRTFTLNSEELKIKGASIITIDLTKMNNCDNIKLKKWIELLNSTNLNSFIGVDEGMSEAVDKIRELNNNEETRLRIDRLKRARLHENTEKLLAREEGRTEGLAEGRAEGEKAKAIAIAKKMKQKNISIEEIIEFTGLTVDEVNNL